MTDKAYLTRAEAAAYVSRKGAQLSKNTLQKFATVGGGPIYRRFGNKALYTAADLDRWLAEKMGSPLRSTSEAA
jgi:hypothetical protein